MWTKAALKRKWILSVLCLSLGTACRKEDISAPANLSDGRVESGAPTTLRRPGGELPYQPAFTIEVGVRGRIAPGQDIPLEARFISLLPFKNARLSITIPDLKGSVRRQRFVVGETIEPQWQLDRGFQAHEALQVTEIIRFPSPGVYRLRVEARVLAPETAPTPAIGIQDVVYEELWFSVDASGGSWRTALDAPTARAMTLRLSSDPRLRSPVVPAATSGCDTWQILWLNDETRQVEPMVDLPAWGEVREDQSGQAVATWSAATDATGTMEVCAAGYQQSYYGQVYLQDADITINPSDDPHFPHMAGSSNGSAFQIMLHQGLGRIWRNFHLVIPRSRTILGVSRAAINVQWLNACPSIAFACYHDPGMSWPGFPQYEYLAIPPGNEPGAFAKFAVGHEYGHAVHNTVLGGMQGSACNNNTGHNFNQATSLSCALREGFAHFHGAIVTAPELGNFDYFSSDNGIELNHSHPGCSVNPDPSCPGAGGTTVTDGSILEGTIAAFLYDLWDGPNTPDSPTNTADGDDDPLEFPGFYIAQIITSCRVNGSTRPNGVDHLIYCFEGQIDPAITSNPGYFPTRSPDPTSFSEGATEPGTWNLAAIRQRWQTNLYGTTTPPPPPPLTVTVSGKSSVRPNVSCLWTASNNGTAPFTYSWRINGNIVNNNSPTPSELIYQNMGAGFTVSVVVTDAVSATGTGSKSVTISAGAPMCTF